MNRNPFHQTIDDLRALRHEALGYALAMYRREQACDPRNRQRMEWTLARIYWTTRAFHYHGEIQAQLDALQNTPERLAQLARYYEYVRNRD